MDALASIVRETLVVTALVTFPILGIATAVGIAVALLQAATQVQEQTITLLPKLLAVGATLVVFGGAALGAHRTDLAMSDATTRHPAALASTGEQKTLLVGLILGHAALIAEARGTAPLLLLDEPAVHLDPERRAALFAALARLPAQTLITGTDAGIFAPLRGAAELLRTGEGKLLSESEF